AIHSAPVAAMPVPQPARSAPGRGRAPTPAAVVVPGPSAPTSAPWAVSPDAIGQTDSGMTGPLTPPPITVRPADPPGSPTATGRIPPLPPDPVQPPPPSAAPGAALMPPEPRSSPPGRIDPPPGVMPARRTALGG